MNVCVCVSVCAYKIYIDIFCTTQRDTEQRKKNHRTFIVCVYVCVCLKRKLSS